MKARLVTLKGKEVKRKSVLKYIQEIRVKISKILICIVVFASTLMMVFPFYWAVSRSLMFRRDIEAAKYLIPPHLTLNNYIVLITNQLGGYFNFPLAMLNSVIYTTCGTVGVVLFCSMAGFILAKRRFKGSNIIFLAIIGGLMFHETVSLIPNFVITFKLGWYNTYRGLIIPAFVSPFSVFLFRQYMVTIPDSLIEAAEIDGASIFWIFSRIILPLSKPVIASAAILKGLGLWNSMLWPLIITTSKRLMVLTVALLSIRNQVNEVGWGVILTTVVLMSLPMIIVFFVGSKWLIGGLTRGALKG